MADLTGSSALTLPLVTLAASGIQTISGTSALTLPICTSATAGARCLTYPTSLSGDTTLTAETYIMNANCDCNSFKLTFNCAAGNIVVKRSGDYYHTEQGAVDTTNSDSTHKVYWTVENDDTIGAVIGHGAAAVLGGSWGNGTANNNIITMNYWEIRWSNNKNFLTFSNSSVVRTLTNWTLKNCAFSSTTIFVNGTNGAGTSVSNISRWQVDNTNTFTTNSMLMRLWFNTTIDYIYIQSSNTAGSAAYTEGMINTHLQYNSSTTFTYLNISNSGGAGFSLFQNVATTVTFNHCKCVMLCQSGNAVISTYLIKNCVFTGTNNITYGFYHNRIAGAGSGRLRIFNSIFKGFTLSAIVANAYVYIEACRNNIFDSNAKIVNAAAAGLFGIKNNGYYNNTSEANWTRGPYDTSISDPSWTNFPGGTLHSDWTTYGPGDGWYTTQDIPTGADTNSFVGINTATQSHTGTAETATTQRLGLAPVFSVLA